MLKKVQVALRFSHIYLLQINTTLFLGERAAQSASLSSHLTLLNSRLLFRHTVMKCALMFFALNMECVYHSLVYFV